MVKNAGKMSPFLWRVCKYRKTLASGVELVSCSWLDLANQGLGLTCAVGAQGLGRGHSPEFRLLQKFPPRFSLLISPSNWIPNSSKHPVSSHFHSSSDLYNSRIPPKSRRFLSPICLLSEALSWVLIDKSGNFLSFD